MTDREIHQNAANFVGAGIETTANLLCAAIYLLLTHPACLEKIRSEVREAFKTKENINTLVLAKLPYFQAVVDESLRIYPPGLAGQPRRMYPQGDNVSGYWIPGYTGVQLNVYAASHSTMNFRDPEKFVPERWLGDKRYENDRRDALQPFSIGARNCIGKNLALAETRLVLAHMLYCFDLDLCPETDDKGKSDWFAQKAWLTWTGKPLWVKVREREGVF